MAPEVLSKNKYSEKADVYSFAIVLVELFTGKHPYSEERFVKMNQAQLMYHIIEQHARPTIDELHPAIQQLIKDCWALDPKIRPSFAETVVRLRRLGASIEEMSLPGGNDVKAEESIEDLTLHLEERDRHTASSDYSFTDEYKQSSTLRSERDFQDIVPDEKSPLLINE